MISQLLANIQPRLKLLTKSFGRVAPLFVARLIIVLAGVANIKLQTTFLAPHDVGIVSLTQTCISGVVMILVSPAGNYVTRFAHPWIIEQRIRTELKRYLRFLATIAASVALVTIFSGPIFHLFDPSIVPLYSALAIVFASIIASPLASAISSSHLVAEKIRWYSALTSAQAALLPTVSTILILCTGSRTANMWILGQSIAPIGIAFIAWYSLRALGTQNAKAEQITTSANQFCTKDLWPFAAPLVVGIAAWWGQTQLFRVSLASTAGAAELGLVAIAFSVVFAPLSAFEAILNDLFSPKWLQKLSSTNTPTNRLQLFQQIMWQPLIFLSVAAVFVVVFSKSLLIVLASPQYANSSKYVILASLAFLAQHLFRTANLFFHGEQQTQKTVRPALIGLGVSGLFMIAGYATHSGTPILLSAVLGPFVGFWVASILTNPSKLIPSTPLKNLGLGLVIGSPLIVVELMLTKILITPNLTPFQTALVQLLCGGCVALAFVLLLAKRESIKSEPLA